MEEAAAVQEVSTSNETSSETPSFSIPETYQDKGWAKEFTSSDEMWKRMEDLQGLIGKKTVPTPESSDEEWEQFHSKLRPETPEAYELNYGEGFDEATINQDEANAYKEAMHKAGLTQKQAQMLLEADMNIKSANIQTPEQREVDFTDKAKALFGDKAADAIKTANLLLSDLPPAQQEAIQKLPNDELLSVTKLLSQINDKYSREDSPNAGDLSPSRSSGDVLAELTAAKDKMSKLNFTSPEYSQLESQIANLRGQLSKKIN